MCMTQGCSNCRAKAGVQHLVLQKLTATEKVFKKNKPRGDKIKHFISIYIAEEEAVLTFNCCGEGEGRKIYSEIFGVKHASQLN